MATLKCCKCGEENHFDVKTEMPKEQLITMAISYKGDLLKAATVWGTVQNFEKLMISIGKDLGNKTSVSVKEIEQGNGKLTVTFFIESEKLSK